MLATGPSGFAREDLCIVSYNVQGLNVREKCTRLLRDLKYYKASVALLQETHFQEGRAPTLKDRNFHTGYFSHNPDRRTQRVCILFSRRVPYTEHDTRSNIHIRPKHTTIPLPPKHPDEISRRHPNHRRRPQPGATPRPGLDVHTWNYTTQQIRQHAPPPTPPPAGRLLESTAPFGPGLYVLSNDPRNIHKTRLLPSDALQPGLTQQRGNSANDQVGSLPNPHADEITTVQTQTDVMATERIDPFQRNSNGPDQPLYTRLLQGQRDRRRDPTDLLGRLNHSNLRDPQADGDTRDARTQQRIRTLGSTRGTYHTRRTGARHQKRKNG
ncbi:Hypothetical predicted protein [Pelobates cultripes]|uniref:Endonuclease/exonuclease/phosphatase domain-containing protein n=1 Tax=Pelobates cultripes TaxID=61616 RepID=A0AAD1SLP6_PELCU|nr:Hypothetical predicted protein [Pelobates cultripes]